MKEARRLNDWEVSCELFVALEGSERGCWLKGSGLTIRFEFFESGTEMSYRANRNGSITLHALRPVHITVDGEQFVSPVDAPYSQLALISDSGEAIDDLVFLEKLENANRITTEVWNVDDERLSATDSGVDLARAMAHVRNFEATVQ